MSHPVRQRSNPFNLLLALALALALPLAAVATTAADQPPTRQRPTADSLPLDQVAEWHAPSVDVGMLLLEDESNRGRDDIPYRVGYPMQTAITPANSGTWEELGGGDRLWRLRVGSLDALWVVLGFGTFGIQPGGEMTVPTPRRTSASTANFGSRRSPATCWWSSCSGRPACATSSRGFT